MPTTAVDEKSYVRIAASTHFWIIGLWHWLSFVVGMGVWKNEHLGSNGHIPNSFDSCHAHSLHAAHLKA